MEGSEDTLCVCVCVEGEDEMRDILRNKIW